MTTDTVAADLSTLSAQTLTPTTVIHGIITIKWPFSASTQRLTFLLADPDPRRRASGGQVKITLLGDAAEFVDQIGSGEPVSLTAGGQKCDIEQEEIGQRVQWHITFSNGCQVTVSHPLKAGIDMKTKDSTIKQFGPPTAPAPVVVPSLPRIPTPPPATSPPRSPAVWKAPLKRKFEELTDPSVTAVLTDEEEWFGSQPRLPSSNENSRRFSGRMRFISPDGTSSPSTPASRHVTDENSFDASLLFSGQQQVSTVARRRSSPMRRDVSPSVLRAQNLVAAEILSEKILHPPRSVGTGVDEISHAAVVDEGASRRTAPSEKSFDVFMDEKDVLPKELTASVPAGDSPTPVKEGLEPVSHYERSPEEEEEEYESQDEEREDTEGEDEEPEYEEDEDDLQPYDASHRTPQHPERPYYRFEPPTSASGENAASDRRGDNYPQSSNNDDEDWPKEGGKEEEELRPGRFYRHWTREGEDEYLHSDEVEEDSFEESELESEEAAGRIGEPVVVDLTLDSDDEHDKLVVPREYDEDYEIEDQEEEGELEDEDEDEEEDEEEEEEEEDDEEEEDEDEGDEDEGDEEEEYNDESSWQGITSATPFTDISRQSHHHSPSLMSQRLDAIFDQDIPPILETTTTTLETTTTTLETTSATTHANDFAHLPPPSDLPQSYLSLPLANVPQSFPQDLIPQILDPAIFQSFPPVSTDFPAHVLSEDATRLLDSVLSMSQHTDFLQYSYPPPTPATEAGQHGVESLDSASVREFLRGLMPMGDKEGMKEGSTEERQHGQQTEFLPTTIVPEIPPPVSEEIKTRTEPNPEQPMILEPSSQPHKPLSPPPPVNYKQSTPTVEDTPSQPPPPLPETWNEDGLTTPLGYYPPLPSIRPPTLREQKANLTVDAIGIIRSLGEIQKTKGPDYLLSLFLVDPSTGPEQGVSTQFFRPYLDGLPRTAKVGNVLLLTNMKVESFEHRGQIRSTESSGWVLFDEEGNMVEEGPPVELGRDEREMVRYLGHWWRKVEKKPVEENLANSSKEGGGQEHGGAREVGNGVNGHTDSPTRGVVHKTKHRSRRGGRVVNLNR